MGSLGATVRVIALGVPIDLDLRRVAGLEGAVRRAWSRCLDDESEEAPEARLIVELGPVNGAAGEPGEAGVRAPTVDELMELLSQHVTYRAISARAGEFVMLHACALANATTGAAVALVGPSGMGKTTLAAHWGKDWAYVSDETVAVDRAGRLWPYPKPLSVIDQVDQPKTQLSPDELGLATLRNQDLSLARVILLDRDPEHTVPVALEDVPRVEAIAYLAEQTSFLARLDRPLARLATAATAGGGVLGLRYRDQRDVGPILQDLLRGAE